MNVFIASVEGEILGAYATRKLALLAFVDYCVASGEPDIIKMLSNGIGKIYEFKLQQEH